MIKFVVPKPSEPPIYRNKLDLEDKLYIDRLKSNLFKLSGYNKPFCSQAEKIWVIENLKNLNGQFDEYGNYHRITSEQQPYLYICSLNEKTEGIYTIYKNKSIGNIFCETNNWEPLILAANTILYTLIEQNTPGHFIFCRQGGYKWIKENRPSILKKISIGFLDKNDSIYDNKLIYLHQNQWPAFPKHRINAQYKNKIADFIECKQFSLSDFGFYYQDECVCVGINPGVETKEKISINMDNFLKIGLFLKNQKLINL